MKLDEFRQQQPVVFKTLQNGLLHQRLSHCYLFSALDNIDLLSYGLFFAQSILCDQPVEGFACQKCNVCQRVLNNNYGDLVVINGKESSIKISEIEQLQKQFDKTALEQKGVKVFIINDCEKLTAKAANSLLKFIEEPTGDTIGIFLTHSIESVIPTIVSRCQNINFKPVSKDYLYDFLGQGNYREAICHLSSNLSSLTSEAQEIADDEYFSKALTLFENFIAYYLEDDLQAIVYLQSEFSKIKKTDDKSFKKCLNYFLDIASLFCQDLISNYQGKDPDYQFYLAKAAGKNINGKDLLNIFSQCKDSLNKNCNGLLVIDRMLYLLYEVIL
ncbi:MAG: hypothetical protein ACI4WG_02570 [Erysipelotrichaceae bacterium]